ncbi:MAG: hypothetical protein WC624_02065, partial [Candidatus Margulisiibacteriota bacterium]
VLADYMPFPLENLAAKFPALGALNSDGRFSTRFTDLRSPRKINVPFWQVAIYLFDSFPAKLIHKKGGEYYEVLFKMIFPYDLPDAGGDCYDSGQQKEGILRALEIAKSTGQPPINIPDQLGYETKLRRIGNLNQYQFGSEIEAITRGLDTATFFVNNQALTTIIKLAQAAGDLPWLLQILDMGRLQLKTQDPYGFNILTGDPVNFCWVDLTIPLWQEVLERRGLRCQAMHYQNFLETGLGHKVCLLESLLRKETRFDYSFNRSLLPPELDYYLMDKSSYRQPGFDKYLLSRLGAIVARAIREDHKLFLTPQGDDDLGMAFEADLDRENIIKGPWFKPLIDSEQPNPRQFRLIDYLTAHIDLVWGKDAFHERRGNESGVDLNYIEISNHLSPSA